MRKISPILLLAAVMLAVPANVSAATRTVSILDYSFSPQAPTYLRGDYVVWKNIGRDDHDATPRNTFVLNFSTGRLASGASSSAKLFKAAGSYGYFCSRHPWLMSGTIRIAMAKAPATGTLGTTLTVRWASAAATTGYRYVVWKKNPGTTTTFSVWKQGPAASASFTPTARGTYSFQSAYQRWNGSTWVSSGRSPTLTISVT